MRVGLYRDEYGDTSKYHKYPCCEIDLDHMTLNTDYTVYLNPAAQTVAGLSVKLYHFSITAAGSAKITNKITNPDDLLISNPFWAWNDTLSKRSWMGQHYTSHSFESEPEDWQTALYWKYYLYTADTNFEQYKTVPATFNAGNTYYTCDAPEYEPQRIFYADNDHASSFVIGQFVGGPPAPNTWFGYGSGGVCNGVPAVAGIGGAAGTDRRRIFAAKQVSDPYTGYAGMTQYAGVDPVRLVSLNTWVLTGSPVQNIEFKTYCQLAHITYGGKEYIGWGTIFYDPSNPNTILYSNFTCVNIECFQDAIMPDAEPYSNGGTPGNSSGSGGTGPGLPDGDSIDFTRVSGGLMPLGYGLHAYQVLPSDVGLINDFLWGRSGNAFDPGGMWARFQNYKFNPVAGICSLHHIPFELLCAVGSSVSVSMAGITFDGVSTGGVSITGLPIDSSEHVGHCRFPSSGYFEIKQPYIGFEDFSRTKVRLYLPFCGSVDLDPALCIGGGVAVDYQCDNINGNVCVQVKTQSAPNANDGRREFVAAVASGNAAYHIPITGNDNGTGEIIGSLKQAALGALSGNLGAVAGAAVDLGFGLEKHTTSVSGSLAGNVGYLGSLDVILEITYGDYFSTDGEYEKTIGRPSYVQGIVNDFAGFCQFKVHTDGISGATETERQEIAQLMEQGVIIE